MTRRILGSIVIALLLATFARDAGADAVTRVMILGTFHMDNPGHDLHNMQVDDVLQEKRQRELAEISDRLMTFRPTAVMVESQRRDPGAATLPRYREFLAGTLAPSRNEVVQVGFRLAKAAGLTEVYGIDVDGEFPYEAVQAFAAAHGQGALLEQQGRSIDDRLRADSSVLAHATLGATLRRFNTPSAIATDHEFYPLMLKVGNGDEQPGAALAASWNTRNLEICARMVQLARPGDRVVVLYGAGHAFLLRQCVKQMPGFELVEPNAYLP